jgi:hypothetical protein
MTTQSEYLSTRNEKNESYVRDLRELADWLERHPELDPPSKYNGYYFLHDKGDLAKYAKSLERAEKDVSGEYFIVRRKFGSILIEALVDRGRVCERVVTGQRRVEAVPAHFEDIVEWKCPESVIAGSETAHADSDPFADPAEDEEIPF